MIIFQRHYHRGAVLKALSDLRIIRVFGRKSINTAFAHLVK